MTASGDKVASIEAPDGESLRILHIMRAPVGGLFRHVGDLACAQALAGHDVGIVADLRTGGDDAARALDAMAGFLKLGVTRIAMRRQPCPDDLLISWRIARLAQRKSVQILHGHGAKGGLYARLPALLPGFPRPSRPQICVYTPHGGSLHFRPDTALGKTFFTAERIMGRVTDFISFESDYARRRFTELIETPQGLAKVVPNGISMAEFAPVVAAENAADFVFIGEMRVAKGVEDLLYAFAMLPTDKRLALVGSGGDEKAFRALARRLGVLERVTFHARTPTRDALAFGHVLVAPSRAESLPYIVLEAIAARVPVVATDVGGIREVFAPRADLLAPPGDPKALARAMRDMSAMNRSARQALLEDMAGFIRKRFVIDFMNAGVLAGYRAALAATRTGGRGEQTAEKGN